MKNFKINSLCSKPSEPMPRCQDRCRHCRQKQLEYTKMQSVLRSEALEVRVGKYKRLVIFSRYIGRNRASLKRYFSSPEKQVLHLKYLSPIHFFSLSDPSSWINPLYSDYLFLQGEEVKKVSWWRMSNMQVEMFYEQLELSWRFCWWHVKVSLQVLVDVWEPSSFLWINALRC